MEGQKKSGSSSSSFTSELFGSSESQRSSASSSAGIFASMFPQPGSGHQQDWGYRKGSSGMGQQERGQPCHLSSSLYYGGQDVYSSSSSTTHSAGPRSSYEKDKEDDDPNGNNSQGASRGNWWQEPRVSKEDRVLVYLQKEFVSVSSSVEGTWCYKNRGLGAAVMDICSRAVKQLSLHNG